MDQDPQIIFDRIAEKRKKLKDLRSMLEEGYEQSSDYLQTKDTIKQLRAKQKTIKEQVNSGYQKELDEIDALKADIDSDKQLLTDLLLSAYVKGKSTELKNEYHQAQLPLFSVKFVKP